MLTIVLCGLKGTCPVWIALLSSLFCRCERLEEQLSDLTELHRNEMLNLKEELAGMEEKIAYQSYESAMDIHVSFASISYFHSRRCDIARKAQVMIKKNDSVPFR